MIKKFVVLFGYNGGHFQEFGGKGNDYTCKNFQVHVLLQK